MGMELLDSFINVQKFIDKSIEKSRFGVGRQGGRGHANIGIDLNEYLIINKNSTFFFRLATDNYLDKGIHNGSVVVIDRSLFPQKSDLVLCFINGEYVLRNFVNICNDTSIEIWGVVSGVIKKYR